MTEVPQNATKIIVVAEEEVYNLLRDSGAHWDVQHRVESVGQMWDDLSGGRLDQQSVAIVFSDSIYSGPGELEAAVAAMAPYAATFVVAWNPDGLPSMLDTVQATIQAAHKAAGGEGEANVPVHVLYPDNKQHLLDAVRDVLLASGAPVAFPETYAVDVNGPVVPAAVEEPVWEPAAPEVPPAVPEQAVPPMAQPTQQPVQQVAPVAPQVTPTYQAPQVAQAPAYSPQAPADDSGVLSGKPVLPGQVTMAVTSSKGGSGKSTTAMMLAAQIAHSSQKAFEAGLAERPLKVVLVDMDTRDGQVASLIGRYVPTALNIRVSPTWDEETILGNLVHDPKLGIDALLAPVRPRTADDVGPDFYRQIIRTLKTTHDVVIMDTSVNYLDPLISTVCLPESTAILFVTTLATTSVQGMARALREITEPVEHGGMGIKRTKIGIVVNQSITEVGMDRDQVLQAALKVSIVGAIPLATKDVLTCTNFNRMHQLLKHPLLGPAYYKLAKTCLPKSELTPIYVDPNNGPQQAPAPAAVGAPVPVGATAGAPAPAAAVAAPAATGQDKKRGLFGRKG